MYIQEKPATKNNECIPKIGGENNKKKVNAIKNKLCFPHLLIVKVILPSPILIATFDSAVTSEISDFCTA